MELTHQFRANAAKKAKAYIKHQGLDESHRASFFYGYAICVEDIANSLVKEIQSLRELKASQKEDEQQISPEKIENFIQSMEGMLVSLVMCHEVNPDQQQKEVVDTNNVLKL